MSKKQYINELHNQIEHINGVIDRKIVLGRAYKTEARRHRILLTKLRRFRNPGFFDKIGSVFHREYA